MEYTYIFYIIQFCFFISCLMVFCVKKTLHSVFMLITSFVFGAAICVFFEAYFISFLFIIVYVGAIAVLFLFVLMLLDFKDKVSYFTYAFYNSFIISSVIINISFFLFYKKTSLYIFINSDTFSLRDFSLLNFFIYQPNVVLLGQTLYTWYFIQFILISLVLFVAMLGAILITSSTTQFCKPSSQSYKQNISDQVKSDSKVLVKLKNPIMKFLLYMLFIKDNIFLNGVNIFSLSNFIQEFLATLLVCSVFFPFFTFLFIFFFGSWFGNKGVSIFCILVTFVSWVFSVIYIIFLFCIYFFSLSSFNSVEFMFASWFNIADFTVQWGLYFDMLSVIMIFTVLFVTLAVQIYCLDYMWFDPFFSKFYAYLALFSFFMLFLVSSNNYLQVFLGWEGVGLASFLLISFWNTRKDAVTAGFKAILVNRIGDLFFIWCLVIIGSNSKTLNFVLLFETIPTISDSELNFFSLSLVIAAMAKSAQLGLHTWLPDAMEGPTPVSALIHAATMVTAGVFVIIRSSPIIITSATALEFMCLVGGLTALFGSTVASVQVDIKKIIAYSTCSQLGYMFLACGCANFSGAFFHLFTHAFFKALLFLSAGSVIHAVSNEQDIRKMGALYKFLPFTYVCVFFGSLSLTGFPLFSGFYSKDFILEYAFLHNTLFSFIGFIFGLVSIFFTSYYSFRLLYFVFFAPYSGSRNTVGAIADAPRYMLISMSMLLVPATFFGFLFVDIFVGKFSNFIWLTSISNVTNFFFSEKTFIIDNSIKQLPFIVSTFGFVCSYLINYLNFQFFTNYTIFSKIYLFFAKKWYFDDIYNYFAIKFMRYIYTYFWLSIERGLLIKFGPHFFKATPVYFINFFSKFYQLNFFGTVFYFFSISLAWAGIIFLFVNFSFVYVIFSIFFVIIFIVLFNKR